MNYEEKYNNLVAAIKQLQESNPSDEGIQNWVEDNVPELCESEDERIRKALVKYFSNFDTESLYTVHITEEEAIAWLEKQGQVKDSSNIQHENKICEEKEDSLTQAIQKPAWSEEDAKMLQIAINACNSYQDSLVRNDERFDSAVKCEDWLKSLRPQKWTKEDKERYISCLQRLSTGNPDQPETINSKWFKEHVYPQSTWKPSEDQLKALRYFITSNLPRYNASTSGWIEFDNIQSLYNDLKKLKGE